MQKCICIFALSPGTAGMGKERVVWMAQVEYAKVLQNCNFALSAGMAGMGKERVVWLAQVEYAKLQKCAFGWYGWQW